MAHNPPRVWFTTEDAKRVRGEVARKLNQWHTLDELADRMLSRAAQGKRVVLSPGTADYLGKLIKQRLGEP